ncbi:MAG: S8 family serine peptidase [bacterium]
MELLQSTKGTKVRYPDKLDAAYFLEKKMDFIPNEFLIIYKPNTSQDAIDWVHKQMITTRIPSLIKRSVIAGSRVVGQQDCPIDLVTINSSNNLFEAIEEYRKYSCVLWAEPNTIVKASQATLTPNDILFPLQWNLDVGVSETYFGAAATSDINAPAGWYLADPYSPSAKKIVAVVDSGVDTTHYDLLFFPAGNIVGGWDCVLDQPITFEQPGIDLGPHGTLVAGIIGATANNFPALGVVPPLPETMTVMDYSRTPPSVTSSPFSPNLPTAVGVPALGIAGITWNNAQIMPVRGLAGTTGDLAHLLAAVEFAINNGANIINASWTIGSLPLLSLELAILKADQILTDKQKGILFVCASGNDGKNIDFPGQESYPASYPEKNIIAVASTNMFDRMSAFSNYGAVSVDIAAPGELVMTTAPNNYFTLANGTSLASPHVAGVAAFVWAKYPKFTHDELKNIILLTAEKNLVYPAGMTRTGGDVNLYTAFGGIL